MPNGHTTGTHTTNQDLSEILVILRSIDRNICQLVKRGNESIGSLEDRAILSIAKHDGKVAAIARAIGCTDRYLRNLSKFKKALAAYRLQTAGAATMRRGYKTSKGELEGWDESDLE